MSLNQEKIIKGTFKYVINSGLAVKAGDEEVTVASFVKSWILNRKGFSPYCSPCTVWREELSQSREGQPRDEAVTPILTFSIWTNPQSHG